MLVCLSLELAVSTRVGHIINIGSKRTEVLTSSVSTQQVAWQAVNRQPSMHWQADSRGQQQSHAHHVAASGAHLQQQPSRHMQHQQPASPHVHVVTTERAPVAIAAVLMSGAGSGSAAAAQEASLQQASAVAVQAAVWRSQISASGHHQVRQHWHSCTPSCTWHGRRT
jgi:hypothetical protein